MAGRSCRQSRLGRKPNLNTRRIINGLRIPCWPFMMRRVFRFGRYQKRNGRFSPHSKFNISSVKQAKQVVQILQTWIDEYGEDE